MVEFKAVLQKFGNQGEKTGWTYIEIPLKLANKIKAGTKKSFRVKGKIDAFAFKGALLPMGGGDFIFAVKGEIRKKIKKFKGDTVLVKMEEDKAKVEYSKDLVACLKEDKNSLAFFNSLAPGHRNYFSKWIDEAKTEATKVKRLSMAMNAFSKKWGFPEMLRAQKKEKSGKDL